MNTKDLLNLFNDSNTECFFSNSDSQNEKTLKDTQNILNILEEFKQKPNIENEKLLLSTLFSFASNRGFSEGYDRCYKDYELEGRDLGM